MDEKIKLPEIVMLVDAAFLNFIVSDLKRYFENVLNRPLQEIIKCNCYLCMIRPLLIWLSVIRQI